MALFTEHFFQKKRVNLLQEHHNQTSSLTVKTLSKAFAKKVYFLLNTIYIYIYIYIYIISPVLLIKVINKYSKEVESWDLLYNNHGLEVFYCLIHFPRRQMFSKLLNQNMASLIGSHNKSIHKSNDPIYYGLCKTAIPHFLHACTMKLT